MPKPANKTNLKTRSENNNSRAEVGDDYTPSTVTSADPGIQTVDMDHQAWIPFAHDWSELSICVDMVPATGGKRGQVIAIDRTYLVVILIAPSVTEFLSQFAEDLESGRYFLNPDALKEGDGFLSCDPESDLVNWWKSPRWKHLEK